MHVYRPFVPPKHEHRLLSLILTSLYFVLWWDKSTLLPQMFLFLHFMLLLLWQPLWAGRNPINLKYIGIFACFALVTVAFFNLWILSVWQIILLGLIGGRDLVKPRDRFINIIAIAFLAMNLFIINLHHLFIIDGVGVHYILEVYLPLKYGLLCIPIIFLFISASDNSIEHHYHIDFFHALTLCLLITIIALGSVITMLYTQVNYPVAVFQMAMATALFIIIISWLWIIFAGEESVGQVWTYHLLNIGNSFEQWLDNIAQPHNYKVLTPQQFLYSGFEQVAILPWVSGIAWRCSVYNEGLYSDGKLGVEEKHSIRIILQSLEITVYSSHRISGNQYFQAKLLIQLLEHFHQAKRREDAFAQQAHLQAIYETGAKLTHDIKNLLQSLHAISSAIETCQPAQFGDTQRLLQGQMPHLTQRLKRTLDKLEKPSALIYSNVPIKLWWENLKARYRKHPIDFSINIDIENVLVPEDLFDNVVENLLQNAIMKSKREPDLQIEVSLSIEHNESKRKRLLKLTVCDDGSAIPPEIIENLLSQPVPSRDGFGIGLYQAAKQLKHSGYELTISQNFENQVCFELANTE